MDYVGFATAVSLAAAAPNPTFDQHLVMLVSASRPLGWFLAPILYIVGMVHSGMMPGTFGMLSICLTQIATFSFPLCIIVFGINDVHDYPSDMINPRKSASSLEGIVLPPAYHSFITRAAVNSSFIITFVSVLPCVYAPSTTGTLHAWTPTFSTAALVGLGWIYSAPPLRLKQVPFLDSLSNSLICWLAWFVGFSTCYTLKGVNCGLGDIPLVVNMLGLITFGAHAQAAAVDLEADLAAGDKTIATVLGRRRCAVLATAANAIAFWTQPLPSFFGIYFGVRACITLSGVMNSSPRWMHHVFQATLSWTIIMACVWMFIQFW